MLIESANKTFFSVWESTERMGVIFFWLGEFQGLFLLLIIREGIAFSEEAVVAGGTQPFPYDPHILSFPAKKGGKLYGEIILPEAAFLRL